jgi:hypothetical protein
VKLWPREVFYIGDTQCAEKLHDSLNQPGIYVLYQDFDAFYVGQSECLFDRLRNHAMKRYVLWNHFSAFIVPNTEHLDEVEAMIIAATPRTANRSGGKRIHRVDLPKMVEQKLIESRRI